MTIAKTVAVAAVALLLPSLGSAADEPNREKFIQLLLQKIEDRDRQLDERDTAIKAITERLLALERRVTAQDLAVSTSASAKIAAGLIGPSHAQRIQAPGEVIVDEQAAERALERTLAIDGALLIPSGRIEVEPSFTYTRRENEIPVLFNGSIASNETRRNEFEGRVNLRLGLPLDSQLEIGLPYQLVDQSRVTSIGNSPVQNSDGRGAGLGDISLGIAKTLVRERGIIPDIIGRVSWNTDIGDETDNGIPLLGNGFNEVSGSLVAVKRQDPLVFVGSASYQRAFEANDVKPGDQIGLGIATFLAASPDTTLRFSLDQTFIDNVEVNGQTLDGSDGVAASLTVGASTILAPGILLDASASIGLTKDSPDYTIRFALPIRLNSGF